MPFLLQSPGKFTIQIKVKPNSQATTIYDVDEDNIYIAINEVPSKDKANKELIKFIALLTGIAKININIIRGKASHNKVIEIRTEMEYDEILSLLKGNY